LSNNDSVWEACMVMGSEEETAEGGEVGDVAVENRKRFLTG